MSTHRESAVAYAREHRQVFRSKLEELLAIPSISTDPAHDSDVQNAAKWLSKALSRVGAAQVEILPTEGKPIVWGEIPAASAQAPTILVYGHYDVQPVDPLELWDSDPFTATERSGALHARGASDMKGQVMAALAALEAIHRTGAEVAGKPENESTDVAGNALAGTEVGSPGTEVGSPGRGSPGTEVGSPGRGSPGTEVGSPGRGSPGTENSSFPVTIRFLLEGEEEIGSPSLESSIQRYRDKFAADLCLNADTGMIGADHPTITYGLRGLAYFEVRLRGPSQDLHSGIFGGALENPAHVLTELLAGLHDENGRVTLPGFYDRVRELPPEEREELARLPVTDEQILKQTGAPALYGETGYTTVERLGARPTLEINGLLSGFTGAGAKTVLPSEAMAKISTRLVPDQDPAEVRDMLTNYFKTYAPETVTWDLEVISLGPPLITERDNPGNRALARALERVWGTTPLFKREGGSVPVSIYLQRALGMPSVLTGFGLPDDNLHAPNEKLDLPTWYRGIEALIHFFFNVAQEGL